MKALLLATTAPDGSSHQQTGSTNWILRLCKTLYLNHKITLLTPPSAQDPWIEQENISLLELPLKKTSARLPRIIASFFRESIQVYGRSTRKQPVNILEASREGI